MKKLWPYAYFGMFVATCLGSAGIIVGPSRGNTNVDWTFIAISFVGLLIFPTFAVSYALSRTSNTLQRASITRGFVGFWWSDPMQWLLVSIILSVGWFLGSLFTLENANPQGVMIVWWKASVLIGLIAGSLVAHSKFRNRIT
jgi:hypothetical protein